MSRKLPGKTLHSDTLIATWGFPKTGAPFLGVLIIRIMKQNMSGSILGPPIFGNLHTKQVQRRCRDAGHFHHRDVRLKGEVANSTPHPRLQDSNLCLVYVLLSGLVHNENY